MAKLSPAQIASAAYDAGFRDNGLAIVTAIALAESSGETSAQSYNVKTDEYPHGSVDRGLWQLNDCYHSEVTSACAGDPSCSAKAVYRISSGGTDFAHWHTFISGTYKKFMQDAIRAAATIQQLHKPLPPKKTLWHRELSPWHYYGQMDMPIQAGYRAINRENDCGPACITMCLQHWFDIYLSEDHINILEAGINHIGFTSNKEMAEYLARAWGIPTEQRTPNDLTDAYNYAKAQIKKLFPVISLGKASVDGKALNHFTVVTGIKSNKIVLADPGIGKRLVMSKKDYFDRSYILQLTPQYAR